MIWVSRELESFTEFDNPQQWASVVKVNGVEFRELNSTMYDGMKRLIESIKPTSLQIERFERIRAAVRKLEGGMQ